MLKSVFINRFHNLELQNLDIHNASGARDGPAKTPPPENGGEICPWI